MIDGSDLPQIHIANFDCCACAFLGVPKKLIFCERFELQLPHKHIHYPCILQWWQKLWGGHSGPPPKSLDSDENFKPEHKLICHKLRFVAIYALFGDLWAKKVPFWVKNSFLGQEVHYYMVYIAYFTELILQICDYAKKRRI